MAKAMQIRHIKLQPKCRPSQSSCNGLKEVPWLNISGIWLEKAGFNIGNQVEIRVETGRLIIKNRNSEEDKFPDNQEWL